MSRRKVLDDWLIATQEAIAALQALVLQLDEWRANGEDASSDDFMLIIQQLNEAGLMPWLGHAGGHSLADLLEAVGIEIRGEILYKEIRQ
jgi:hypothetical protein